MQYHHIRTFSSLILTAIMWLLLPCTFSVAKAQNAKLSPHLRDIVSRHHNPSTTDKQKSYSANAPRYVCAMVKSSDVSALKRFGCTIFAEIGDIIIANIPVNHLTDIASLSSVKRIEAETGMEATLDITGSATGASLLWDHTMNPLSGFQTDYTGKDVVIGVVDIGFDLTHPTFRNPSTGASRIRAFWDQMELTDEPGNEALPVGKIYSTPAEILEKRYSKDAAKCFHGTHTAGIAAGSGLGSPNADACPEGFYAGMAPESDIILVGCQIGDNVSFTPEGTEDLYTSATIILAYKYIFDQAASLGKPCVISYSIGRREDYSDENMLYEEAINALLGPGRIFVASVGNESSRKTYLCKPQGQKDITTFIKSTSNNNLLRFVSQLTSDDTHRGMDTDLTFYVPECEPFTYTFDTQEVCEYPDSTAGDTIEVGGLKFSLMAGVERFPLDKDKFITYLGLSQIDAKSLNDNNVEIALTLRNPNEEDTPDFTELYSGASSFEHRDFDPRSLAGENTHNVLQPGGFANVIGVGATHHRQKYVSEDGTSISVPSAFQGQIENYSSRGPMQNGLRKPDVMAPGGNIVSALNSAYIEDNTTINTLTRYIVSRFNYDNGTSTGESTYGWYAMSGTSMATPVVAGIIAQWLQACPTLTTQQAIETISMTSSLPDSALSYPNNTYGYGEINAAKGLSYILEHFDCSPSGISDNTHSDSFCAQTKTLYNLLGQRIRTPKKGEIYIINGKKHKR